MAEFVYQNPFPVKEDTTKYRLITKDFVSTEEFNGRKILKVKPEGLELLAREAFFDVSFFLRSSHMRQLAAILEDPEASDNERFVAYTMIKNQVVSAEGKLPTCQDTGTAIIMAKKGEDVYTGVDDAMHLSKGIFDVWQQNYLRYSILAPLTMTEEKNTTTNLPAQIDIYSSSGNSYEFLIVTKGGGSANKSLLFQQTKSLLNEENLTKFFKEKISELGSAACPPYHLAIVIGGSSADWWYGQNKGKCNWSNPGTDAAKEIQNFLNTTKPIPPPPPTGYRYVYVTDTIIEKFGHEYEDENGNHLIFYIEDENGNFSYDDYCLDSEELNFHYFGQREVIYTRIPQEENKPDNWVLFFCKLIGESGPSVPNYQTPCLRHFNKLEYAYRYIVPIEDIGEPVELEPPNN
jgi:hypothetical protein